MTTARDYPIERIPARFVSHPDSEGRRPNKAFEESPTEGLTPVVSGVSRMRYVMPGMRLGIQRLSKDDTQSMKTTIQTPAENHILPEHYAKVEQTLNQIGYSNGLMGLLTPRPSAHADIPENVGITPQLSKPVRDIIQKCQIPFDLVDELDGYFGKSYGSGHVTTIVEKEQMTVEETIEKLEMRGMLEGVIDLFKDRRAPSDPDANTLLAYTLATLSKGWVAEKLLNESERWKTGSVSQDDGGMDLYDRKLDEWVQLKPVTVIASNGHEKFLEKEQKHLWYFWDSEGNIQITDTENWKVPKNEESEKTGLSGTLLIKSANLKVNKEYGRPFRYLWW